MLPASSASTLRPTNKQTSSNASDLRQSPNRKTINTKDDQHGRFTVRSQAEPCLFAFARRMRLECLEASSIGLQSNFSTKAVMPRKDFYRYGVCKSVDK